MPHPESCYKVVETSQEMCPIVSVHHPRCPKYQHESTNEKGLCYIRGHVPHRLGSHEPVVCIDSYYKCTLTITLG